MSQFSEINDESATLIKFQTDGCEGQKNEVNFLEHVQLVLDAHYPIRGHLSISITSPQGESIELPISNFAKYYAQLVLNLEVDSY